MDLFCWPCLFTLYFLISDYIQKQISKKQKEEIILTSSFIFFIFIVK